MSRRDMWAYNPDVCDGDFCPMNCDNCHKQEAAEAARELADELNFEPDDSQLEMGYNPYIGGYDFDC